MLKILILLAILALLALLAFEPLFRDPEAIEPTESKRKSPPPLIMLPPSWPHETSYIIANREGLERLRLLVDEALAKGDGRGLVRTPNGEGYELVILLAKEEEMPRPVYEWEKTISSQAD